MSEIEKLDLTSMNVKEEQIAKLKQLFPETFTEGNNIDWDKLKLTLGENIDVGKERYGMNWPGKADCFKAIQQQSTATLVPDREESVNFDTTENLFIEGDNLEVLKLLQKSYLGKIKMIYIDPPYNTGNDFIYPDNYIESLDTYLEYTGQIDSEGKKFSTNTDTDGRFHSKWMNMMYPRLFLAKNLLKEDGLLFVSIDDNEVYNLKIMLNELFGEENFVSNIVWQSKTGSNDAKTIDITTEYILVVAKQIEKVKFSKNNAGYNISRYKLKDEYFEERGPYYLDTLDRGGLRYSDSLNYGIDCPDATKVYPNGRTNFYNDGWTYKWSPQKVEWGIKNKYIELKKQQNGESDWKVYYKVYLNVDNEGNRIERGSTYKNLITEIKTGSGTLELNSIFGISVFKYSKPYELILEFMSIFDTENDYILDFFAGSCTTAHAAILLNFEKNSKRKFICIQLPEPIETNSEVYNSGYKTIADIGKERIRRVMKNISAEIEQTAKKEKGSPKLFEEEKKESSPQLDLGFKVLKLTKSNFSRWDSSVEKNPEAIQEQLFKQVQHISPEAEQEAVLYELLLKSGFELTTPIKKLELENKLVFSIGENELLICLEKQLTHEVIKAIAELKPIRVICLDEGFQNNDQLKTNAALIMKSNNVVKFQTV